MRDKGMKRVWKKTAAFILMISMVAGLIPPEVFILKVHAGESVSTEYLDENGELKSVGATPRLPDLQIYWNYLRIRGKFPKSLRTGSCLKRKAVGSGICLNLRREQAVLRSLRRHSTHVHSSDTSIYFVM